MEVVRLGSLSLDLCRMLVVIKPCGKLGEREDERLDELIELKMIARRQSTPQGKRQQSPTFRQCAGPDRRCARSPRQRT